MLNKPLRAICLIDGEHYPAVSQAGIEHARCVHGYDIIAAVFIGGNEKVCTTDDLNGLGIPVITGNEPFEAIARGLHEYQPDVVLDLSDDPVVRPQHRFKYANLALAGGAVYAGADFRFEPPEYLDILQKPSISIVGTAKRVGKTAVASYIARLVVEKMQGIEPLIVTMGRGGPPEPELVPGDEIELTPGMLLEFARKGKHAASDHFEDALTSRVATIGCRRCGGGFAGAAYYSVVPEGALLANGMRQNLLIFEGSGASIPPVKTDAWTVIVGAHQGVEYVEMYVGPYRIMKSDLAVVTMCEEPMANTALVDSIERSMTGINPDLKVVRTVLRPKPLGYIGKKKIVLATTAPPSMQDKLKVHLEEGYGCSVVGVSHDLSNRPALGSELGRLIEGRAVDALLTELKAAAVDVATAMAVERGIEVVYADNVPVPVGDDLELETAILGVIRSATERFRSRNPGTSPFSAQPSAVVS